MRLCVLILIGTLSAIVAHAATPGSPDSGYESLRDEAHVSRLVEGVAADIKAHHYDAALKKATEAEKLQPHDSVVLNAKGAALTELKRFDEASKALDEAVAADPKAFAPQFNQGEVLFLQKKYFDAGVLFVDLQNRFGTLPLLKYKIYLCFALAGEKDKASEALALMRYPQDDVAWYFAYAVDRLLAAKNKEARRLIAVADAINPDGAVTYHDTLRDTGLLK